jgi:stage V sporulation protein B
MGKKSFVAGAVILMAAGLTVRALGFVYRVFLSNTIGAEGMGIYQLVLPVYSLIMLTLTSGISIGVSKLTAEQKATGKDTGLRRIAGYAAIMVFLTGIAVSALLYLNIDYISNSILKDNRTYFSLLTLIPAIPISASASAIRGYFFGVQRVVPPALSQIVEQTAKMCIVMSLAGRFIPLGLEYACAVATSGMVLGEIAGFMVVLPLYLIPLRKKHAQPRRVPALPVIASLLKIAVPVSSNRFITSLLSTTEYILIPSMLAAGGLGYQQSIETFGKLNGMAFPLILFPSLVTFSLATTLVPAISEAASLKRYRSVNARIAKSIRLTLVLGIIFTFIFLAYANEISDFIYRNQNAGSLLFMLAFSCTFIYLQHTLSGILNGLGKQGTLLRNNLIGIGVRMCSVLFLIPIYGIKGYIYGLTASYILTNILDLIAIHKVTGLIIDIRNWYLKPALAGAVMFICCRPLFRMLSLVIPGDGIRLVLSVAASFAIGFLAMLAFGVMKAADILKLASKK